MASNINPTLTPTTSLDNFKFWCQKVLPLVYDDSLSYYEVLGKMVVQLNGVIDNINADTENVLTLKDAFDELQEYVDNFFDDVEHLADYAERAEAAQTAANSSAINAASSAVNASISSQAAMDARAAAQTAAQDATASKNDAITAATTATTKASEAAQSAINAQTAQAGASQSATLADAARSAAQTAAATASEEADEASASASAAATSEQNVETLVEGLPSDFTDVIEDIADINNKLATPETSLFNIPKIEAMDLASPSETNRRSVIIDKNTITCTPTIDPANGSTFFSFKATGNATRYLGGNITAIMNNIRPTDFIDFNLVDSQTMILDLDFEFEQTVVTSSANIASGGFYVLTYDPETERVSYATIAVAWGILENKRIASQNINLIRRLPALRKNKNICIVFQSRYPCITEKYTMNLRFVADVENNDNSALYGHGNINNADTALRNYNEYKYIYHNGEILKTTANIAQGTSLEGKYAVTSLLDILNDFESRLDALE